MDACQLAWATYPLQSAALTGFTDDGVGLKVGPSGMQYEDFGVQGACERQDKKEAANVSPKALYHLSGRMRGVERERETYKKD